MSRPRLLEAALPVCLLLLSVSVPALADAVRLLSGDKFGQGWMFLDTDLHCKVVTAGHVVRGLDGKSRPTDVLDGRGRTFPAGPPQVNAQDPDIAVLPIPAADDPATCGDGRLSPIGVARRVANLTGGRIRTSGESEIRDVPVARRASAIDDRGGGLFAVRPTLPGVTVQKGWSGSTVLDDNGPVGIVFEVDPDTNEALAVRVDLIRDLMAGAPLRSPDTRARSVPAVAALAGTTADPAAGPSYVLAGTNQTWRVTPTRHAVVLLLRYSAPTQLREIHLAADPGPNAIEALDVSTQAELGDQDWTWANYCRISTAVATCRFLQRTISSVRIVVRTRTDDPIALSDLVVE